jgi:hypothetical protein
MISAIAKRVLWHFTKGGEKTSVMAGFIQETGSNVTKVLPKK